MEWNKRMKERGSKWEFCRGVTVPSDFSLSGPFSSLAFTPAYKLDEGLHMGPFPAFSGPGRVRLPSARLDSESSVAAMKLGLLPSPRPPSPNSCHRQHHLQLSRTASRATSGSRLRRARVTAAFCWTRSQAATSAGVPDLGFSDSMPMISWTPG